VAARWAALRFWNRKEWNTIGRIFYGAIPLFEYLLIRFVSAWIYMDGRADFPPEYASAIAGFREFSDRQVGRQNKRLGVVGH